MLAHSVRRRAVESVGEGSNQVSMKGKTLLAGHSLTNEGEAFAENGFPLSFAYRGGEGCGLCSCGEVSKWLPTRAARKRWHRTHKDEVRAQNGDSSGTR